MVTVLLTRPRASSEKLAHELKRHGFDSVIEPLLSMEPLVTVPPDLENVQAVMITSANTLNALEEYETGNLLNLPCFCVGPRTGEGAQAFGFRFIHNASGDGTDLARLIGDVMTDKNKPVLHIAAQDVDSKARDELGRRGYKVVAWPVYAAKPALRLTEQTVRQLEPQKLDAVMVFSVRTAQVLRGLLSQNGLEACCKGLSAIGLSEAVADALRLLPWRELIVARLPTEDAMIECLKQINPVS